MAKPTGSTRAPRSPVKAAPCAIVSSSEVEGKSAIIAGESHVRSGTVSSTWRTDFLITLAVTSNVTAAAVKAGIKPDRAYKARRCEPAFAKAWREALCEGYDNLELELLHRLRFGETKEGDAKFDNANALRLLTQHRETVARHRAIGANADVAQVRTSIHAKLLELRAQVLARRKAEQENVDASHG